MPPEPASVVFAAVPPADGIRCCWEDDMEVDAAPAKAAVQGGCIGAEGGGVAADAFRLDINLKSSRDEE